MLNRVGHPVEKVFSMFCVPSADIVMKMGKIETTIASTLFAAVSGPQIEAAIFCAIRRINNAIVLPPVRVIDPPLAEADFAHSLAVSGRDVFLALGMEGAEVCDGGEHRHPAAGIDYAILQLDHARLAGDLDHRVHGVHLGQVSFVIVPRHDDTAWRMRSRDSAV